MKKLNRVNIIIGIFDILLFLGIEVFFISMYGNLYTAHTFIGILIILIHGYGFYYSYKKVKNNICLITNFVGLFYGGYLVSTINAFFYYRPVVLIIAVILLANGLISKKGSID